MSIEEATRIRPPVSTRLSKSARRVRGSRFFAVTVLLVLLFVYFSISQPNFFQSQNITLMLTSAAITFLVAIGMTFVLLSGGFDLSMGAVLALSGIALGSLYNDVGLNIAPSIVLTLLLAGAVGAANGFFIGRLGLSFLVVTLGTSSLVFGCLNLWSNGQTTSVASPPLDNFAFGTALGVPFPVIGMIAVYCLAAYVLRWTYFGRDVYAVGGSPDAARLSGIKVSQTIVVVYLLAGLLAGVAGVLQVARVGAASPQVGTSVVFDAAAAVLLGGTSLGGGVGGVHGTVIGVLFLAVLQNGLALAGVESYWQQVVTGLILIGVIAIDAVQHSGFSFRSRPLAHT